MTQVRILRDQVEELDPATLQFYEFIGVELDTEKLQAVEPGSVVEVEFFDSRERAHYQHPQGNGDGTNFWVSYPGDYELITE